MALIRGWKIDFAASGNLPLVTNLAAGTDRTVYGSQVNWTRYNPTAGVFYGHTPYGTPANLWRDTNHSQIELLWLIGIMPTSTMGGIVPANKVIPAPVRTVDGVAVAGLDLTGGKLELELLVNNVHLSQYMQLAILGQWEDKQANAGRGGNVNYLLRRKVTIDQVLGYTPAYARSAAGETRTTGWYGVSVDFPADDPLTVRREDEIGLIPISGRVDKIAANVYGTSVDAVAVYQSRLINLMLIAHNGTQVPTAEPLQKPDGNYGEVYCRKCELWVDPVLNPLAVAV